MEATPNPTKARTRLWRTSIVATAALLAFAATAAAQEEEGTGITVEFNEDGTGFNVTSNMTITAIMVTFCDGTEDDLEVGANATSFVHTGNQTISNVTVFAGEGNESVNETFESDLCPPDETPTETESPSPTATETEEPCAPVVTATAHEGPMNRLTWTSVDGADSYNVYRASGGGEAELLASVDGTEHEDSDVTAGTTYEYSVKAVVDGEEMDGCAATSVTTIPVLPTLFAGLMAGLLGIAAYVAVRRRL